MKFNIVFMWLVLIICCFPGNLHAQDTLLTLEGAVALGLQNNLQVLASKEDITAARGRAITVLGIDDPVVSAEWSEIPQGSSIGARGERDFAVSQSIDFPTNYIHKKKLGDLDVQHQQFISEYTKLVIRTEIEKAWYRVLAKRDRLQLIEQHIRLAQEFLDKAQIRYEAGKAAYLEVSRAQLALANVENERSVAEGELMAAKESLHALLALPEGKHIVPADSLTFRPGLPVLDDLLSTATGRHPQIQTAEMSREMARQDLKLARGSYLPSIEGSYFTQEIAGNQFHGVGIGLTIPLWFPLNQRGKVMQQKGRVQAAQYRSQDEKIRIAANIRRAFARATAAGLQVKKYRQQLLTRAKDVYDMTLRSYEEGKADYLMVLDAQQSLIMINAGYIDALAGYNMKVADLERASNYIIFQ